TDISIIIRKQSKTGKHEHEKRKSTKEARDSKPKPEKVKLQVRFVKSSTLIGSLKLRGYAAGRKAQGDVDFTLKALTQQKQGHIKGLPAWQSM
ncbi:hypothetical protein Tco_1469918, partial [Tanacetum coccineum]